MQTLTLDSTAPRAPHGLWAAAALGALWNSNGVHQFAGTFTPAGQAAMTAGMTPAQAALYLALVALVPLIAVMALMAAVLRWTSLRAGRRGLRR